MNGEPIRRGGTDRAPSTASFAARLAAIAPAAAVPSPCVDICRLDPAGAVCVGCRRTLAEIAGWGAMTDAERRAVWCELPGREPER